MKLSRFAFLADENIHHDVVAFLREHGLDVATVSDSKLAGAADSSILDVALRTGRIVLTHDRDFGALAVAAGQPILGIIYLRPGHIQAEFTVGTLKAMIEADPDLTAPFILVAARTHDRVRIRIRSL